MWKSILSVAFGAALGALLRWELGLRLNNLFPTIPPGTLAANLIGGYIIGVAIAYFSEAAFIARWRIACSDAADSRRPAKTLAST